MNSLLVKMTFPKKEGLSLDMLRRYVHSDRPKVFVIKVILIVFVVILAVIQTLHKKWDEMVNGVKFHVNLFDTSKL